MRNPKRIEKILKELEEIWKQNPDLRLGQLIQNVYTRHDGSDTEIYYVEDREFILDLKEFYRSIKSIGSDFDL